MSEIHCNDKVKGQYEVFVSILSEEHDMRAVADELISFGYKKLIDAVHQNEVILVYCKEE